MADPNEKRNQAQSSGQQAGGQQAGQQSGQQGAQQRQSNQPSGQQSGAMQTGGQGQRGGGLTRRSSYAPSMFGLSPSTVFSMSPFDLMRRFTDELDRAFEDLGLAHGSDFGAVESETWAPPVEVFERDNNLVVHAELPGTDADDVTIELTDDGLVIEGERAREHEESREGTYRSEIVYGHFYRLIPLPEGANVEQAQAQINNGVLEIVIPMAETRRQRRSIPIGTGGGRAAQTAGGQAQTTGGQAQTATGGSGRK
jgi:HSP20 family protein